MYELASGQSWRVLKLNHDRGARGRSEPISWSKCKAGGPARRASSYERDPTSEEDVSLTRGRGLTIAWGPSPSSAVTAEFFNLHTWVGPHLVHTARRLNGPLILVFFERIPTCDLVPSRRLYSWLWHHEWHHAVNMCLRMPLFEE